MTWKTIVLGGLAMWVVMFAVSMVSGMVVHEGLLEPVYQATNDFWRPELRSDPPDVGALFPRWIATGVLTTMVIASIYACVASALGPLGWANGMRFGFICSAFTICFCAGWSGMFNLPDKLWIVWGLESFVYYLPAGAVLGLLHKRFST
jgi:hypothetical protein